MMQNKGMKSLFLKNENRFKFFSVLEKSDLLLYMYVSFIGLRLT